MFTNAEAYVIYIQVIYMNLYYLVVMLLPRAIGYLS